MKKETETVIEISEAEVSKLIPDEKAIAKYLNRVLEEYEPAALAKAVGLLAHARGIGEVAMSTGLTRQTLYNALNVSNQPRFGTISRVCAAFGVKIAFVPETGRKRA